MKRAWGIWDETSQKWLPNPLTGQFGGPARYKTRGEAERAADQDWRPLNPDRVFTVKPIKEEMHERRSHFVADFDTLDDLIQHAAVELGATHVAGDGAHTKLYFPRGGQYPYEEAKVWKQAGYWHSEKRRVGVEALPSDARSIGRAQGRRAAENGRGHVRDYIAFDRRGRPIGPPFKHYGDARDKAERAGGHVEFVHRRVREGDEDPARRKGSHDLTSSRATTSRDGELVQRIRVKKRGTRR